MRNTHDSLFGLSNNMNSIKTVLALPVENFWKAVRIYCEHPNSINKQVLFSQNVICAEVETDFTKGDCVKVYHQLCEMLIKECAILKAAQNIKFLKWIDDFDESLSKMNLIIRKLTPKLPHSSNEFYEFLFLDKSQMKVYIFTKHTVSKEISEPTDETDLKFRDPFVVLKFSNIDLVWNHDSLEVYYDIDLGAKGINWLNNIFIPKFLKLMSSCKQSITNQSFHKLNFTNKVDVLEYYELYEKLKAKYAKTLIKNWTENTDPKKFVHEDIGIATYLLLLWKKVSNENTSKKVNFVDLGCGNGLLVHILNSEGHLGVGYDIRKRKIWDTFGSSAVLVEKAIIPTADMSFPNAEWLIGNHSDELTPWIPIMARRSNNYCQYFVLPCCSYQLNGRKFQRKNSGLSSYQDFLNYVKEISELCEFRTYIDRLRIPSTKRICLIGMNKSGTTESALSLVRENILELINKECKLSKKIDEEGIQIFNFYCFTFWNNLYPENINNCQFFHWKFVLENNESSEVTLDFKIRESTENVRNCTKLPPMLADKILKEVRNALLKQNHLCSVVKENKIHIWNRGEKLSLGVLAENIDEKLLKELKKECKGLQTFLKNHHFIFEIKNGFVQFRCPESMLKLSSKFQESEKKSKWKKKNCWFYNNHPDKCPLSDEDCSYNHST